MQDVPKIVQKRLQETAGAEAHPDGDFLTAFAEQSLRESERTGVMEHLARCGDCREVVALALPAHEAVAVPATSMPSRRGWFSWPVLRWSVAIAGIIAIASFGILQYRQRQKSESLGSNLTAQNEPTANAVQALPQSPAPPLARSESQSIILPAEKSKQADKKKQAEQPGGLQSSNTENFTIAPPTRAMNRAAPAGGAVKGATSGLARGGVAGGNFLGSGSGTGVAAKAAAPSARNTATVVGELKNATPEETAKLEPRLAGGQAGGVPSTAVTIEAAPQSAEAAVTTESQAADQIIESPKGQPSQYESSATLGVVEAKDAAAMSNLELATPRWSISAEGNSGQVGSGAGKARSFAMRKKTAIQGNPHTVFRAVSAAGAEVWAGGSAAMLYHSTDSGLHWARIVPSESEVALTGDITSIEFSDSQHGKIATSAGEVWITADDGKTWSTELKK